MSKKNSGKQFMLGAMVGSTVGALSALMLKSKKGSAFQKNAMDKFHEFENYINKLVHGGKKKVAKTVKKIHKTVKKAAAKKASKKK